VNDAAKAIAKGGGIVSPGARVRHLAGWDTGLWLLFFYFQV